MNANKGLPCCSRGNILLRFGGIVAIIAVVLLGLQAIPGSAQQLTGTLSGLVVDQTGASIPNAKIDLRNEISGDLRSTVSDKQGYFNITAVQPATYSLIVSASGFANWQAKGIVMGQGDQKTIPNIALKIGAQTSVVTVVAGADVVVPTDTAEVSTDLNEKTISDFPLGGRNTGEMMKMMPGFARANSTPLAQAASFNNTGAIGSNTGPVGDFSANGTQPNGAMAYMLDGSNLVDPGNFGTQIANINPDMVSEVKVLTSSYGAEYAKGPVIFEAFSKTGGSRFHGEGYLYARNNALNSWDWYTKQQYLTDVASNAGTPSALGAELRPNEHYWYMGGSVGGPLILPFTNFNRKRDKLFFWVGYEYMNQLPAAYPVLMNVPTAAQLTGDFSNSTISPGLLSSLQGSSNGYAYYGIYNPPAGATRVL